jgi:hypothetical protein
LLALLFVAVSLGVGYLTEERHSATRTFMSPVVVHFTSVFFLSAVALFPSHQVRFLAALIGVTALIGAILSTYITVQVVRTDTTNHVEDYLAYGLLPGLGYLALLAAAVSIYLEKDFGLDELAAALLLLAIVNIRNAWDRMLTMVRRHRRADRPQEPMKRTWTMISIADGFWRRPKYQDRFGSFSTEPVSPARHIDVLFDRKATHLLHGSEMPRWAKGRRHFDHLGAISSRISSFIRYGVLHS